MAKGIFGVDKNIVLLGFVSFLTDISSEMIFSVFAIFFTVILGASVVLLGIIEGASDFAASSLDYISGFLSDKLGKRKIFASLGYGFSTFSKFFLVIANSVTMASMFRVIERLGKSFRGPPRDAWISSLTTKENKGYSFAFHKSLDKAGAILGPIIAYLILKYYGQTASTFKTMFIIAIIPAILAVILLLFVKEVKEKPSQRENIFTAYRTLGPGFKHYLKTAGIFSFAYFSFAFLMLKAYIVGFTLTDVVLLYALFNISFVIFAIPIGKLGDKIGRKKIVILGYIVYFIMSLGFIFAYARWQIICLFLLFGIFYSIDESQSKAYITDLEPKKRGTAIGTYNFFTGLIYLPASIIAGALWNIKPEYAFIFAAVISLAAMGYFIFNRKDIF